MARNKEQTLKSRHKEKTIKEKTLSTLNKIRLRNFAIIILN